MRRPRRGDRASRRSARPASGRAIGPGRSGRISGSPSRGGAWARCSAAPCPPSAVRASAGPNAGTAAAGPDARVEHRARRTRGVAGQAGRDRPGARPRPGSVCTATCGRGRPGSVARARVASFWRATPTCAARRGRPPRAPARTPRPPPRRQLLDVAAEALRLVEHGLHPGPGSRRGRPGRPRVPHDPGAGSAAGGEGSDRRRAVGDDRAEPGASAPRPGRCHRRDATGRIPDTLSGTPGGRGRPAGWTRTPTYSRRVTTPLARS